MAPSNPPGVLCVANLSIRDQEKVRIGNATMSATAQIIRLAKQGFVPTFLENPASSMLWLAPQIDRLCGFSSSRKFICDFCQYGARWRKRTRIQGWHTQDHEQLTRICHGHGGICSLSKKYHIVLKGQDPTSKQLWTHLAQPYPLKFAQLAAQCLADSFEHIRSYQLKLKFHV